MEKEIINVLTNPFFYGILFSLLGGIFGFLGFFIGVKAVIEVKALQRSTHSVQYMPIDPLVDRENEEFLKSSPWATSDTALEEQFKLTKEDLEEQMPEFVLDEDDKKRYSF